MLTKYIKELVDLVGVSSREEEVIRYIFPKFKEYSEDVHVDKLGNIILKIPSKKENVKKLIDKLYKYIATEEVPSAMEDLKNRTGLAPLECSIKNLKATWGICSSKKKISINQNLMAYSRHAIEYVCLHEICHLKHMNHSKQFWNMVEYYMPDYKEAKKELKN